MGAAATAAAAATTAGTQLHTLTHYIYTQY
jgi:hypothetical protein